VHAQPMNDQFFEPHQSEEARRSDKAKLVS
jgi:hypothetical protein